MKGIFIFENYDTNKGDELPLPVTINRSAGGGKAGSLYFKGKGMLEKERARMNAQGAILSRGVRHGLGDLLLHSYVFEDENGDIDPFVISAETEFRKKPVYIYLASHRTGTTAARNGKRVNIHAVWFSDEKTESEWFMSDEYADITGEMMEWDKYFLVRNEDSRILMSTRGTE